jgi:AcrR family transcriptional regulator
MTTPVKTRRADAVRNAAKVLEAAREVFAERGIDGGVEEIAARAGVGKATVYRCWTTKEDLLAAVAGARVDWFTALVLDATESDDPWGAFSDLMVNAAVSCAQNALLYAGLTAVPESASLEQKRATCRAALQHLMELAKEQGRMRQDLVAREVTVLFCGAVNTLTAEGETDLAVWRRYAELVVAATRL